MMSIDEKSKISLCENKEIAKICANLKVHSKWVLNWFNKGYFNENSTIEDLKEIIFMDDFFYQYTFKIAQHGYPDYKSFDCMVTVTSLLDSKCIIEILEFHYSREAPYNFIRKELYDNYSIWTPRNIIDFVKEKDIELELKCNALNPDKSDYLKRKERNKDRIR